MSGSKSHVFTLAGGGKLLAAGVLLWWAVGPVAAVWGEVTNPDGVAVIIGNKAYAHERVPEVSYAHRDAVAFKRYVTDMLGFDPLNIIELHDVIASIEAGRAYVDEVIACRTSQTT